MQGWLELLHDPAKHLVVCGMNEGFVPGRSSSDTWLPESAREALGLPREKSRAARDAYLLHALLEMRSENGRVDLIVGKTSQAGDVLNPSRLLLTAKGERLARVVEQLFAEVEPSDSGVAWSLEPHWKWNPRKKSPKERGDAYDYYRTVIGSPQLSEEKTHEVSSPKNFVPKSKQSS